MSLCELNVNLGDTVYKNTLYYDNDDKIFSYKIISIREEKCTDKYNKHTESITYFAILKQVESGATQESIIAIINITLNVKLEFYIKSCR
jgi:hypothetical protein